MKNEKLNLVAEGFLKVFPVIIKYFILLGDKLSDPEYSYQEYQTLHLLKEYGKVPISTVGSMLLISKPRMTVLVDKLVAAGFVERYPDKKDRRIIKIGLTDKGFDFTAIHRENLKAGITDRFHSLSDADLDRFLSSMAVLQDIMTKTKSEENHL